MKDIVDRFLEHSQEHGLMFEDQIAAERRRAEQQRYRREHTVSIHQCNSCGCFWRRWDNETWSLADEKQQAGKCCDNSTEFLSWLVPSPSEGA